MAGRNLFVEPTGRNLFAEDIASVEEYNPYSAVNIGGAAIEPILTLGSGAISSVPAGLAGLGALGAKGLGFDVDPAEVVRSVQEAGTYQPKTGGGKYATEAITYPFQKIAEGSKYLGEKTQDITGSPTAATAVETALMGAPMLLGMKGARKMDIPTNESLISIEKVGNALYSGGRHLVEPWLKGGPEAIAGRAAVDIAGKKTPQVIDALMKAKAGETAGQAAQKAGSYEFSALQKLAETKRPSEYGDIGKAQQMERKTALQESIARTKSELDKAIETRKSITDPLYDAARKNPDPINTAPVIQNIERIIAENPGNKKILTAMNEILTGLLDDGVPRTKAQEVASSIDGIKSLIADKDNGFIKGQLIEIRNQLTEAMPLYKAADAKYAELSKPINQMQIGQSLEKALSPRLGAEERANVYATRLEKANETVKDVTGQKVPIDKVLDEGQLKVVDAIKQQLDRDAILKAEASKGGAAMREKLGTIAEDPLKGVNVLTRAVTIAKSILERIHGKASKESLDIISKKMQDPKQMAELMKNAKPEELAILKAYSASRNPALVGGAIMTAEEQ